MLLVLRVQVLWFLWMCIFTALAVWASTTLEALTDPCPECSQIKSNHFYCHITTAQVPWWVKFLWACSRQCKKNNNKQFTYGQTVQKKNCTGAFTVLQTVQKNNNNLHMDRQCKKKQQTIYIWTDSAKKLHWSIYSAPDSAKKNNNNNLHMDSTYLLTVQKTMCKIHIHILSTHSVV